MSYSTKKKLRSLGKNLGTVERVALLIKLGYIALKYDKAQEIIDKYYEIFEISITLEELQKVLKDIVYNEMATEYEEAESNAEIPFFIANYYR